MTNLFTRSMGFVALSLMLASCSGAAPSLGMIPSAQQSLAQAGGKSGAQPTIPVSVCPVGAGACLPRPACLSTSGACDDHPVPVRGRRVHPIPAVACPRIHVGCIPPP
jgi:hypothetical protein